jgi:dUTP pyrophosphatase
MTIIQNLRISKTRDVKTPSRGNLRAAGIDFYVPNDASQYVLSPGQNATIPAGIKMDVPDGYALIAFNKSGVSSKKGLQVGACVIDEDYQGEVHIDMHNISDKTVLILPGEKIVQFLLIEVNNCKIEEVSLENLFDSVSERGEGGFGSTGVA